MALSTQGQMLAYGDRLPKFSLKVGHQGSFQSYKIGYVGQITIMSINDLFTDGIEFQKIRCSLNMYAKLI